MRIKEEGLLSVSNCPDLIKIYIYHGKSYYILSIWKMVLSFNFSERPTTARRAPPSARAPGVPRAKDRGEVKLPDK